MYKNVLIRKVNFMTGEKIIAIHILFNILRSKGNQAMKFDQLIEYDMRNIFLEKTYTKGGGETIHRPFSSTSLDK